MSNSIDSLSKMKTNLLFLNYACCKLRRYQEKQDKKCIITNIKYLKKKSTAHGSKIDKLEDDVEEINEKLDLSYASPISVTITSPHCTSSDTQFSVSVSSCSSSDPCDCDINLHKADAILLIVTYNKKIKKVLADVPSLALNKVNSLLIKLTNEFIWRLKDYIRSLYKKNLTRIDKIYYQVQISDSLLSLGSEALPAQKSEILTIIHEIMYNNNKVIQFLEN